MSDCSVSEECVCGVTFNVAGNGSFCAARHEIYLQNHKKCLETRQIQMSTLKEVDQSRCLMKKPETVEKVKGEI